MNEPQFTQDPLPESNGAEGRGGPAIQERPFWSKAFAGKESWLPATLVGVILAVVAGVGFFFLRDAHFSDSGAKRFDTRNPGNASLRASRELGAAGDGGQAPLPPIQKLPDPVPLPVGPVSVHPVTPPPAGAAPGTASMRLCYPMKGPGRTDRVAMGVGLPPWCSLRRPPRQPLSRVLTPEPLTAT